MLHHLNFKKTLLIILLLSGQVFKLYAQTIQIKNLAVDHLINTDLQVVNGYTIVGNSLKSAVKPLILNKQPMLGWELVNVNGASSQSAYRIILSNQKEKINNGIGDVWDSGKIISTESSNVLYQGKELQVLSTYYWRVIIWDKSGKQSEWSEIKSFSTAEKLSDYSTSHYPLLKTDEHPLHVNTNGNIKTFDFGKAMFSQLRLTLNSASSGEKIIVRLGESVNSDGSVNRKPGARVRYAEFEVFLNKGNHTYAFEFYPDKQNTGAKAIKMPSYIGEVMPFRVVEIEGFEGIIQKSDIVRVNVTYPFDDLASHFESSDSTLNAIWDLCKHSIKATSFMGIYVDGDRERIPYEADAYINQLCHYSVDKEYTMARRSHEYLLKNATWPTEWILQSVLMAYNDYLYTGDLRSAKLYYPDLKAKLLLPLREENGLMSTKKGKQSGDLMKKIYYKGDSIRDIVDWPHKGGFGMKENGETDGFVFSDFNAVVNAFHYKALLDMEKLASALGYKNDAISFSKEAQKTFNAFQSLLLDKSKKIYTDGVGIKHSSLHTNMIALAFGLVPEKNKQDVMSFIRSRGMACSVYGTQFLLDAIYDAGDADYALSLLTSKSDRSWYNMIRSGSTITMEAWDNKYKPNQDWNHAWGAVPANAIPRKLMGIEPLSPGWAVFRVKPQLSTLKSASIKVPTIKGSVEVSCNVSPGKHEMKLNVPSNSKAIVEFPLGEIKPSFKINGKLVKATKKAGGIFLLPTLEGGEYLIDVLF